MKAGKRILNKVAQSVGTHPDDVLLFLWDSNLKRFEYLKNQSSIIRNKDYREVRKLVTNHFLGNPKIKLPTKKKVEVIYKEHNFSLFGREVDSEAFLEMDEILAIYWELVSNFENFVDPIQPAGVKDKDLLDAALFHPLTSYNHQYKYSTAIAAAAALMYALSHNHAFHNGNKRTAMVAMLVFLDRHDICLSCSDNDLFRISLTLAKHELVPPESLYSDAEIHALAAWIHGNSRLMRKGERPISYKKFRQILTKFNCTVLENGQVRRVLTEKALFGSRTREIVSAHRLNLIVPEGREVGKALVKAIREDLKLIPEEGIDSELFYEAGKLTPGDFILQYKSVLRRLSRV